MKLSKYRMRPDAYYCLKVRAHAADLLERAAIRAGAAPSDTWSEKVMVVVAAMRGYNRLFNGRRRRP